VPRQVPRTRVRRRVKRQRPDSRVGPARSQPSEDVSSSSHPRPREQARICRHPPSSRRAACEQGGTCQTRGRSPARGRPRPSRRRRPPIAGTRPRRPRRSPCGRVRYCQSTLPASTRATAPAASPTLSVPIAGRAGASARLKISSAKDELQRRVTYFALASGSRWEAPLWLGRRAPWRCSLRVRSGRRLASRGDVELGNHNWANDDASKRCNRRRAGRGSPDWRAQ